MPDILCQLKGKQICQGNDARPLPYWKKTQFINTLLLQARSYYHLGSFRILLGILMVDE